MPCETSAPRPRVAWTDVPKPWQQEAGVDTEEEFTEWVNEQEAGRPFGRFAAVEEEFDFVLRHEE
ncbi:hypothetical protein PtrSN002B_012186, partial [Pyrenophora tritici-repentis]